MYPDDHCRLDPTFTDFSLSSIPVHLLKKQFKNFKVYLMPLSFDNSLRHVDESVKFSVDVEDVKKSIMEKYLLMDWQFETKLLKNNIKIAIIIPHVDDNIEMVLKDMDDLGYYESFRNEMSEQGFPYVLIRFEPRFPDDITNQVRNMGVIYHLSPKYNLDSIKENGFIPQSKNSEYNFPPRVYFFKSKIGDEEIEKMGRTLCSFNKDERNNGEYVLFTLSTRKIPNGVEFIGDCNYEMGICTEDPIPYETVISTREFKF